MTNLQHKEITHDDLKEWITHLSEEEKLQLKSDLDDYNWHSVTDDSKDYIRAIFQIIDVRDQYAKNLSIHFHPKTNKDDDDLIEIILFIFSSIVSVCSENKLKQIKFHTHDDLMRVIFGILTDHQLENGTIVAAKKYGRWIEITLP